MNVILLYCHSHYINSEPFIPIFYRISFMTKDLFTLPSAESRSTYNNGVAPLSKLLSVKKRKEGKMHESPSGLVSMRTLQNKI